MFMVALDYYDSIFRSNNLSCFIFLLPYTHKTGSLRSYIYSLLSLYILWYADPLLATTAKQTVDNGRYYATARKQQQRNGAFCAIRAEVLQAGQ
jgi:hypothetical protein